MRMKKLMLLAAAAVAVVACSKTYDAKPVSEQEIGFGTWAETLTKAEARAAGTSTFLNGDTFAVYGYNTNGSGVEVFNGTVVTYDGTNWTYSPIRFWDPTASYYFFYAVSPSGVSLATAPAKTGLFESNAITFSGSNNDILVANQTKVAKAAYSSNPVNLTFNHITSKVDFFVKKDKTLNTASATVTITSAQLTNVKSDGTFKVKNYDSSSNVPVLDATFGWTPGSSTASYPSTAYTTETEAAAYTEYSSSAAAGTTSGTVANLFGTDAYFVLMPQDLSSATQKLEIAYKITTGTSTDQVETAYTASIPIMSFVKEDESDNSSDAITAWAPGKHYTYTLTIGANAINFTADITDWGTATNGYKYLVQ